MEVVRVGDGNCRPTTNPFSQMAAMPTEEPIMENKACKSGEQHCSCRDRESTKAAAEDTVFHSLMQKRPHGQQISVAQKYGAELPLLAIWRRGDVANEGAVFAEYTQKAVVVMYRFGYFLTKAWGTY